jgi:hypothetical protein
MSCGWSDYEAPDFCIDKIQKARKNHKCCECLQIIPIGEKYIKYTGKWND